MKFRDMNKRERQILRKLNADFDIDFDSIFRGKKIIVSGRREVYVIDTDAYKTFKTMKKDPYSAGLMIGKIKKEKFDLGLEGAALIAPHAGKTIEVNEKQEQVVLYGKDVRSKSAVKDSGLGEGQRCLVLNKNRENIAIGRIEKDKIINIRDRGHYLRSGR